jgi:hypothetical protein
MRQRAEKLAAGAFREPLEGQRWAQQVAAQMLELLAGLGADSHVGLEKSPPGVRRRERQEPVSTEEGL